MYIVFMPYGNGCVSSSSVSCLNYNLYTLSGEGVLAGGESAFESCNSSNKADVLGEPSIRYRYMS